MRWDVDIWCFVEMHTAIERLPSDKYCSHELDASYYSYSSRGSPRDQETFVKISSISAALIAWYV